MKNHFSESEFDIIKKIIYLGLIRAASSLSQLIKEEVELPVINFREDAPENHFLSITSEEDAYYMLSTKVIGDLPAESFLVFDTKNAQKVWEVVLPESLTNNAEMQVATLMEIDNILTASVVTEFSNLFSLDTHGDVPVSYQFNKAELEKFLIENMSDYDFSFSFQTSLQAKNTKLSADFIWSFKEAFLPVLKKSVKDEEINNKLNVLINSLKK